MRLYSGYPVFCGMIGGYNFSTQQEVREMDARADEQERFIKWCETEKDGEKLGGKLGANP